MQASVSGQRNAALAADVAGRTAAAKQSVSRNEGSIPLKSKFTEEEDRAMRQWVAERPTCPDQGKKIWEAAQEAQVTSHSWQSMQNHWRRCLRKLNAGDPETQCRASPLGDATQREQISQPDQMKCCKELFKLDPSQHCEAENIWRHRMQEFPVTHLRGTHSDVAAKFKNGAHGGHPIGALLEALKTAKTTPADIPCLVA